ncbi:MAG: histidine kinase, partial [Chitinophagaceae bacterium]|nr:histidine kinase [Chitinophagaceae bacterium]
MKKIMLLLLCVAVISNLFAQQKKIDSLKLLITKAASDTARVSLLNELCFVTFDGNPEEAFTISRQADSLAKKVKFRRGEARALDLMGDALERLGNYPKSLEVQLESLKMNEELKDTGAIAGCMISLANLHSGQQQVRIALDYLFKAERLARSVNDQRRMLYSINNIGSSYLYLGLFDSALYYLNQAYAMEIKSNDPVAYTANSLSSIHYLLGNQDLGLSYLKMAERSAIETENNPLLVGIYLRKASLFEKDRVMDSAIWYAKRSFDLSMTFKLPGGISGSAGYLSKLYRNVPAEA